MLKENEILRKITSLFDRSPHQINKVMESDAELIKLDNGDVLAVTTDSVVEEISSGLYSDPFQIGWVAVMASISDLAAVGAKPIGILLNEDIPSDYPDEKIDLLQRGIQEACRHSQTYVVGGDTNTSAELHIGTSALGLIKNGGPTISRKGCKNEDTLWISGEMGHGSSYAYSKMFKNETAEKYLPSPSLSHGEVVRRFASSCIDSSDGFYPAIANLMEVNEMGITLTYPIEDLLHPRAMEIAIANNLPPWFFLAGPHGEFELVFTVNKTVIENFVKEASEMNWEPIMIGEVNSKKAFLQKEDDKMVSRNVFEISNLFLKSGSNPEKYLKALIQLNDKWQGGRKK
ncbi:MAG: hypothetical protein HKN92_06320 [Chitinophagales bacterium]|nr:hypothetical protein [Chitinophagales bacterium]